MAEGPTSTLQFIPIIQESIIIHLSSVKIIAKQTLKNTNIGIHFSKTKPQKKNMNFFRSMFQQVNVKKQKGRTQSDYEIQTRMSRTQSELQRVDTKREQTLKRVDLIAHKKLLTLVENDVTGRSPRSTRNFRSQSVKLKEKKQGEVKFDESKNEQELLRRMSNHNF